MSDELAEALRVLSDRLAVIARRDPDLLAAVGAAGRVVAAWADSVAATPQAARPAAAEPVAAPAAAVPAPLPPLPPPPVPIPLRSNVVVPAAAAAPPPAEEEENRFEPDPLPLVVQRCGVKAAACRLLAAGSRPDYPGPSADVLHARAAALTRCDLWMLHAGQYPAAAKVWEDLAGGFEAAAEAAGVLILLDGLPDALAARSREQVLYLAAESQALLFAAAVDVHRRTDNDQVQLYVHVRERARVARIYIDRFLTRSDRVPPERWPDVLRRAAQLKDALGGLAGKAKAREKAVKNLRFKLTRMAADPATAAGEWGRVLELLEEVVEGGLPPTDREVRELLLAVWDTFPEDLPRGPGADRVFHAIDEFLANRPPPPAPEVPEEPTAEVRAVADLLRGREVVFIGGQERPLARKALEEAFGLSAVNWISTRPHESVTVFEAPIARPEVALVLLAIKWASHSYGEVVDYCTKYGKPLVRLKSGYNPNQVAHQILNQVGDRLRVLGRTG